MMPHPKIAGYGVFTPYATAVAQAVLCV